MAPLSVLRLESTLLNGQTFQWRRNEHSIYTGVVPAGGAPTVVSLREHSGEVQFASWTATCTTSSGAGGSGGKKRRRGSGGGAASASGGAPPPPAAGAPQAAVRAALSDYFQLSVPMGELQAAWSAADPRMAAICAAVPGVRILRQPPFECLISFVCSSNNNISRIGQMLDSLRAAFGAPLGTLPAELSCPALYAFPTPAALAAASEASLRALGVGYRAAFISGTASAVEAAGGEASLLRLRSGVPREEVQAALLAFPGVGQKVADCVALFSLDQADALPVDTHVWAIACRDMDPGLRAAKSITPAVYERVGALFRARYTGGHAGWAHSVLFTAELPAFRERLPPALQEAMQAHAREEKAAKLEKREAAKARKLAKGKQ